MASKKKDGEKVDKRGNDGRFLPGHKGGPGRPRGSVNFASAIRQRLGDKKVDDAIVECFVALLEKAKERDVPAIKLLLERLCDNGAEKVEEAVALSVSTGLREAS